MAGFLVLVGLTGSLLAFNTELERVFAPALFARSQPKTPALDLATLAERAQSQLPHARVLGATRLEVDQIGVDFEAREDPATHHPYNLGFDEFYIDPWTGAELGRRRRADLTQGAVNVMPFIYELHWRLVAGEAGQWVLGIVAIAWALDCFVSFYLTLPRGVASFWSRWAAAWKVRRGAGAWRLNFDLHRAGGLWPWALLFVFAWSSVMMNVRPVFDPVMKAIFDYRVQDLSLWTSTRPFHQPGLNWVQARQTGRMLMAQLAAMRHFTTGQELSLGYFPGANAYAYDVRGNRDLFDRSPKGGSTSVMFDGDTGRLIELDLPTGEHAGNTIESWLYALHMARVFGWPYRIFVCILGVVVAMLSLTGIYIWWRKHKARNVAARRATILPGEDMPRFAESELPATSVQRRAARGASHFARNPGTAPAAAQPSPASPRSPAPIRIQIDSRTRQPRVVRQPAPGAEAAGAPMRTYDGATARALLRKADENQQGE